MQCNSISNPSPWTTLKAAPGTVQTGGLYILRMLLKPVQMPPMFCLSVKLQ